MLIPNFFLLLFSMLNLYPCLIYADSYWVLPKKLNFLYQFYYFRTIAKSVKPVSWLNLSVLSSGCRQLTSFWVKFLPISNYSRLHRFYFLELLFMPVNMKLISVPIRILFFGSIRAACRTDLFHYCFRKKLRRLPNSYWWFLLVSRTWSNLCHWKSKKICSYR
jgi:hypothetical protein